MNTNFDELIDKHRKGLLREDEKQLFSMMLRIPENQMYLASKIDEEFFHKPAKAVSEEEIGYKIFENILQGIKEANSQQQSNESVPVVQMQWYRNKIIRSVAVAASIILVIGLGIFLFTNNKAGQQLITVRNDKQTESTVSFVYREVNTTGKEKRVALPDGSLIVLADKSEITYRYPFVKQRDIALVGKAWFKVAKDKTKPFTVNSGDISTTALGTEFTVTASKKIDRITVRLFEGKVVVKPVDKTNKRMKKDVYLLPGQELVYGGPSVIIKNFRLNKHATSPKQKMDEEPTMEDPSIPENTKNPYFMFNNRPVEEVFDQLAEIYNVRIVYNKKDVKNLYFIGRYNSSTSIETILKRVATLNNLTITKQDTAFIIRK